MLYWLNSPIIVDMYYVPLFCVRKSVFLRPTFLGTREAWAPQDCIGQRQRDFLPGLLTGNSGLKDVGEKPRPRRNRWDFNIGRGDDGVHAQNSFLATAAIREGGTWRPLGLLHRQLASNSCGTVEHTPNPAPRR